MRNKMNSVGGKNKGGVGLSQTNSQDVTQPYSQGITQGMSQVILLKCCFFLDAKNVYFSKTITEH